MYEIVLSWGYVMTRYQMYRQATGDTSWGQAPIWLNEQYFLFCGETGRTPNFMESKSGYRMARMQPEEHEPFNEWLIKTHHLKED